MSANNGYSWSSIPSNMYTAPAGKYGSLNNTICDSIVHPSKVASGPTLIKRPNGGMTYYTESGIGCAAYNPDTGRWTTFTC